VPPRPDDAAPDDPGSVEADRQLRDAVLALTDPDLRARFASAARRSVLRRTWSTVGDELVAHYHEVLDTAAAAA
jgi:phosphatidylinositol alpha 1,6-mannosyltransferase